MNAYYERIRCFRAKQLIFSYAATGQIHKFLGVWSCDLTNNYYKFVRVIDFYIVYKEN